MVGSVMFESIEQLLTDTRYIPNNPVTPEFYEHVLCGYAFRDCEARCCVVRPNGSLCQQKHGNGYVLLLRDGTISLIGGDCAKKHFAIDSEIRTAINAYDREVRRLRAFNVFNENRAKSDAIAADLQASENLLRKVYEKKCNFEREIGASLARRLASFARGSNGVVYITGIRVRPYIDDAGRPQTERSALQFSLPSIGGLKVFDADVFSKCMQDLKRHRATLQAARSVLDSAGYKEIVQLNRAIDDAISHTKVVEEIVVEFEKFEASDLRPLMFIASTESELSSLFRVIKLRSEVSMGSANASVYFDFYRKQLCNEFKVDEVKR